MTQSGEEHPSKVEKAVEAAFVGVSKRFLPQAQAEEAIANHRCQTSDAAEGQTRPNLVSVQDGETEDDVMRRRGEALVRHLELNPGPSNGVEMQTVFFPYSNDHPDAGGKQ